MQARLSQFMLLLTAIACMTLTCEIVSAQGRDRGGFGGDQRGRGDQGGRGGPQGGGRGGFGGAPGGTRGGFGGAPGGTRGGFGGGGGMTEMLKRFDSNGNGVLDPDEQKQGPVGFMLQRMQQSNPKIVPGKPIKIADLGSAIEQARASRMNGGRDQAQQSTQSKEIEIEPLVLGFGVEEEPIPILGFGPGAEQFAIQIEEADRVEARRNMSRYDRNRDSILDEGELRRGNWREPALMTDRNGDGKLSLRELELRYAMRRENSAKTTTSTASNTRQPQNSRTASRSRGASTSGSSSSKSKSKSSKSKAKSYRVQSSGDIIAEMKLQDWFMRDDANQDGQIQMAEFSSSWTDKTAEDFAQFDSNNDGVITPQEAEAAEEGGVVRGVSGSSSSSSSSRYTSRGRESSSPSKPRSSDSTPSDSSKTPARKPAGNVSSQYVAFAVKLIKKYDRNKDGVLDAAELKSSSRNYGSADTDGDGKVSPQELGAHLASQ